MPIVEVKTIVQQALFSVFLSNFSRQFLSAKAEIIPDTGVKIDGNPNQVT